MGLRTSPDQILGKASGYCGLEIYRATAAHAFGRLESMGLQSLGGFDILMSARLSSHADRGPYHAC